MTLIIKVGILVANLIYAIIKLFPTNRKKVTFISRQSNAIPLDFSLIEDEIKNSNKDIKIVMLCKTLDAGVISKIKYTFHMFRQMYHIATSKVVILDSYCIPICILKHKKKLVVIQIWHALGSLKKFGYSALDLEDGRKKDIAKLMRMHKNYNYIITSSELSKKYFEEAFNAEEKNMLIMNLPRVDYLKSKKIERKVKKDFYTKYANIAKNKKIILYCPTSRANGNLPLAEIVSAVDLDKYVLVLKLHNNTNKIYYNKNDYYDEIYFSGIQFLHIADYIITDYSAIVYEAAITHKPIYLYAFDYEKYVSDRGFYIDYKREMPGIISKDIDKIISYIDKDCYDDKKIENFCQKYLSDLGIDWTKKLVEFIFNIINIKE